MSFFSKINKKHLKKVGPIRHNEPLHAHSPDVASGTVARRLRIDVHDNANDDNDDNDNDNAWQREQPAVERHLVDVIDCF